MTKAPKIKRKVQSRIYVFSVDGISHQLQAENARDLTRQVTKLVPGTQTKQMARLAWTSGEQADITAGKYRIACVGQVMMELWGKLPKQQSKQKATESRITATEDPDQSELEQADEVHLI